MAGALLKVIGSLVGQEYDSRSLVHAVLMVHFPPCPSLSLSCCRTKRFPFQIEQMLTTGGGWQDQVGGLIPGFKFSISPARLPLAVEFEILPVSQSFIDLLQRHLILIYTGPYFSISESQQKLNTHHSLHPGRTRLARGLLQDVLRRWHARFIAHLFSRGLNIDCGCRLPEMVALTGKLVENAHQLRRALLDANLPAVGACLGLYWSQKKAMAGIPCFFPLLVTQP